MLWQGAGAGSRQTIGVVIFAGAMFATLLTLFVVPIVYGVLARDSLDKMNSDGFEALRQQFEVNAIGPLRVAHALLNNLHEGSKIAIMTSRMGSMADNGSGGYYGYRASNSIAGTRSNTPIKDIPLNIQVFTKDLYDDLVITNQIDLERYNAALVNGNADIRSSNPIQQAYNAFLFRGFVQNWGLREASPPSPTRWTSPRRTSGSTPSRRPTRPWPRTRRDPCPARPRTPPCGRCRRRGDRFGGRVARG